MGIFPTNGVLKEIIISCISSTERMKGEVIPYGVEILDFGSDPQDSNMSTTIVEGLPLTINTLKNVVILKPPCDYFYNIEDHQFNEICYNNFSFNLPPNLTSLSFYCCDNITPSDTGYTRIPNTIKELHFNRGWSNGGMELKKGDLHDGLISLSLGWYKADTLFKMNSKIIPNTVKKLKFCEEGQNWDNEFILKKGDLHNGLTSLNLGAYQITKLSKGVLPNSVKELTIYLKEDDCKKDVFNFITPNIVSLYINIRGCHSISPLLNLKSQSSIKYLTLDFKHSYITLLSNTIPKRVTNLNLILGGEAYLERFISKGVIPNSVTSLSIRFKHRDRFSAENYNDMDTNKFVSLLPQSLTSITLPHQFKELNINLPKTITGVNYIKYSSLKYV